jgi:hypothetical protein
MMGPHWTLPLLLALCASSASAAASSPEFAAAERARYAALCHAHKDLNSCSDAVRWSPGDPALVVALADALVRARRLPEALRDYQHAQSLQPDMHGLDAKIKATQAALSERHAPKKPLAASIGQAPAKRLTNVDPETESH